MQDFRCEEAWQNDLTGTELVSQYKVLRTPMGHIELSQWLVISHQSVTAIRPSSSRGLLPSPSLCQGLIDLLVCYPTQSWTDVVFRHDILPQRHWWFNDGRKPLGNILIITALHFRVCTFGC